MSNSKIMSKVELEVQTKDQTADIYLIDSSFRVVEKGRGTFALFHVKPGIYTVKIRVGFESKEQDVILVNKSEKVIFEVVEFPSAIPLYETALTHEYQVGAAESESRKIHLRKGIGSWIYIFTRDWKPNNSNDNFLTTQFPHQGLKLFGKGEELIVDFENNTEIACNSSSDAWSACNVELDPGEYRLSVEIESGKCIEQTIIACRNWQTQVFLLQKNYGNLENQQITDVRRSDLTNTGILMTRGVADSQHLQMVVGGFDSKNPKMKLLDLARIGLANHRQTLPDELIDEILNGKFENPMLGLLGAYLLLKSKKNVIGLLKKVVDNLCHILGEGNHPDLEALRLRIEPRNAKYDFDFPPMLRQSWIQVINSTANIPNLMPIDSFACQNSERMLGDEPWLLYLSENQIGTDSIDESVSYMVQQLNARQPFATRSSNSLLPTPETTFPSADFESESNFANIQSTELKSLQESIQPTFIEENTINDLVNTMNLPKAKVIQILERIESKS